MAKTFDFEMFRYTPSLVGAIIAIIIYSILAGLHFWQWFQTRQVIILCVVLGALGEIGGYGARVGAHYNNTNWGSFIVQGVLILVGPLFFAATIYMMLGRTIRLAGGEDVSIINPKWCTRLFLTADISTLIIQGLGASIMGTMKVELAIAGEKIVIAGLALQVATFLAFVIVATDFHVKMNRKFKNLNGTSTTTTTTTKFGSASSSDSEEWRKMLKILYGVSSLILFRCIFRLIEYSMGNAAYLMAHEWTLYVFDTAPMVLVLLLMLILQPTRYIVSVEEKGLGGSNSEADELVVVQSV